MRRYPVLGLAAIMTVSLAACTTTPALAPGYVAALHSGKIVVVVPRPIVFLLPRGGGQLPIFIPTGSGALLAFTVPSGQIGYARSNGDAAVNTKILRPYRKQIKDLPVANEFVTSVRQASKQVVWIHNRSPVMEYDKSVDTGQMHRMTQKSSEDAVVFVHPVVIFSHSLGSIYILATMSVYAHGPQKAAFLDGGQFVIAIGLSQTRPPLSAQEAAALAAYKSDNQAERQARAGFWFANDASRLKDALSQGMTILQRDVNNYLNGRRVRS